ncbi:MAG: competence/damage-inducible protein A [Pseudomonadales bacterium]|jgi:molybdenum cofactor synthesis domain-containing protein|nr:competence/damage-inducible protein A [Pseudomonadales bacterium]
MSKTVTSACLIIIGNEILSGRTQDTNLAHLSGVLNELGIRMLEARVIPDIESTIVDTVNQCRNRFDYVFTTGGIGPTHDDITADSLAKAFGVEIEEHPEVAALIKQRPATPEVMASRLRMARIPVGATLIENPTGGPPGFQLGNVFVMAGVPMVMQAMASTFDRNRLPGGEPVRSLTVGAFLGESQVAEALSEIQSRYPEIDLGSYPFYRPDGYGTNLVMRGTEEDDLKAMAEAVTDMISSFGATPYPGGAPAAIQDD